MQPIVKWVAVGALFLGACDDDEDTGPLAIAIEMPDTTIAGTSEGLQIQVLEERSDGTLLPLEGVDVDIDVQGGTAAAAGGTTDADGLVMTRVTATPLDELADDPRDTLVVVVTLTDPDGDVLVEDAAAEIWDPGLLARYDGGTTVLEAPIWHGWLAECEDTGNNLYQGECVSASQSPADWAWDMDLGVGWEGLLYTGDGGPTEFSAWVDGDVLIEVNDVVVADLDTVGSPYQTTLDLPADTWVPVEMRFDANGGSNHMNFASDAAGGSIPVEDLATPRTAW